MVNDPVLTKQIFDTLEWSKRVAKLVEGGNAILDSCHSELTRLLKDTGTGDVQAGHGARIRLPKSLSSGEYVKWDTKGPTGIKNSVGPLPISQVITTINSALRDLSCRFTGNECGRPLWRCN
jgi:hypothetical protein